MGARQTPLLSLITDLVYVELYSVFGLIISAISGFLFCPFSLFFKVFLSLYLSHHLSLFSHLSACLFVSPSPPPSPSSVSRCFYKLYRVQRVEDVGDADTPTGREEEERQDRSSLHHSSPEERGETGA